MTGLQPRLTEKDFGGIFSRLAIQLRWLDADVAAIQSYYAVLSDLLPDFILRSAQTLAQERGRKFFPTTGEWRDVALRLEQDDRRAEYYAKQFVWTVECTACEDVGWELFWCEAGATASCGRRQPHAPHRFVRICPCRATNATYQRHQWEGRKNA